MKANICIVTPSMTSPKKSQNTSFIRVLNDMFIRTSVPFRKHSPSNLSEHPDIGKNEHRTYKCKIIDYFVPISPISLQKKMEIASYA